jgi:phosphoglycerate dehydrogenase-like enzyme
LINAGRGSSVDTEAVVAALGSGQLRAAVLDVLPQEPLPADSPLWRVPELYITSHTAAPTPADGIVQVFLSNLQRWQAGLPPQWLIDFERGY